MAFSGQQLEKRSRKDLPNISGCQGYRVVFNWILPTPVFLPGKFHGWRSLVGCGPWGRKESDTTDDGGAWWAVVRGVAKSQTRLRMEEPGGLWSVGSQSVRHDWGWRSLVGCGPWGRKESDWATNTHPISGLTISAAEGSAVQRGWAISPRTHSLTQI